MPSNILRRGGGGGGGGGGCGGGEAALSTPIIAIHSIPVNPNSQSNTHFQHVPHP